MIFQNCHNIYFISAHEFAYRILSLINSLDIHRLKINLQASLMHIKYTY